MWFLATVALFYLTFAAFFILDEIFGPFGLVIPLALFAGYFGMKDEI